MRIHIYLVSRPINKSKRLICLPEDADFNVVQVNNFQCGRKTNIIYIEIETKTIRKKFGKFVDVKITTNTPFKHSN